MSEYTPTTAEVRGKYATHQGARYRGQKYRDRRRAEFDRWLNAIKAEAWEEGFSEGVGEHPNYRTTNPYRQESGQ